MIVHTVRHALARALSRRGAAGHRIDRLAAALALLALQLVAASVNVTSAGAQVRPVEPIAWRVFDGSSNFMIEVGAAAYDGQRVAARGTSGRYEELPTYAVTWRTGRVALSAAGSAIVRLRGEERFRPPLETVSASAEDAGPVVIEAAAVLTPLQSPVRGVVRFGTRLPVTSDESGLDRDQTDFYATLGAQYTSAAIWAAAEGGVSINGRRAPARGQKDVFIFAVGSGYRHPHADVSAWLVGRDDLHDYSLAGHEDLRELRLGVRSRGRIWAGAQWIHGISRWSPSNGVRIAAGVDLMLDRVPVLGWQ